MNISVKQPADHQGLYGPNEIWVHVTDNEPISTDWPTIREHLAAEHNLPDTPKLPKAYFPGHIAAEERANLGYSFEEWYVFNKQGSAA